MTTSDLSTEQQTALDNFANLSKQMAATMDKHNALAEKRRAAGHKLKELGVAAPVMAKAAEISVQAVYKLLQSKDAEK